MLPMQSGKERQDDCGVAGMTDWLRLWHDMPTDSKWRTISRKSGQPIPCVIALFNLILVNASANDAERGTLRNWRHEDAASALDMDEEDVAAIVAAMEGRVIEGGRLMGWEKRQPKREDGTAAERKEAWKQRQIEARNALERTGTQQNAPETYTETDTERSGVAISPAPSERAAALKAIEGPCLEIVAGTDWPVTTAQDWHALTAIVVEHRLDPETELLPSIREQVARKQAKRETVRNWGYFVPGCLSFAAKAREPPKPFPEASSSQTYRNGARNDPRNTQTPMQRALDALKPRGERPIGSSDGRTIDGEYELSAH
jgi:hypothetical protein